MSTESYFLIAWKVNGNRNKNRTECSNGTDTPQSMDDARERQVGATRWVAPGCVRIFVDGINRLK